MKPMTKLRPVLVFLAVLIVPLFAHAAAKSFSELVENLVSLINTGIGFLLLLGIIMYFWGISVNVLKFEDDPEKKKAYFFWGIIVLFVMFSIWGIIELLQNTLFGGGSFGIGSAPASEPGTSPTFFLDSN